MEPTEHTLSEAHEAAEEERKEAEEQAQAGARETGEAREGETLPEEAAPREDELQVQLSRIREGLAELDRRTRGFVKEHPLISVAGAVAAGYVIGRIGRKLTS